MHTFTLPGSAVRVGEEWEQLGSLISRKTAKALIPDSQNAFGPGGVASPRGAVAASSGGPASASGKKSSGSAHRKTSLDPHILLPFAIHSGH